MLKSTPGPWAWFGNAGSNSLYLATTHSGRRYVMGFKRWGFGGAQPQFQPAERGLVDASKLFTFEVGDRDVRGVEQAKANTSVYRLDINGIDCADARLIAAAPDLLAALEGILDCVDPEGIGTFGGANDVAGNRPTNGELVLKGSFIERCMRAAAAIARAKGTPS